MNQAKRQKLMKNIFNTYDGPKISILDILRASIHMISNIIKKTGK